MLRILTGFLVIILTALLAQGKVAKHCPVIFLKSTICPNQQIVLIIFQSIRMLISAALTE
jgi:hypothetical protein